MMITYSMQRKIYLETVDQTLSGVWETYYEGEETKTEEKPPEEGAKKTFTQEELNNILAEDRRKHKKAVETHVNELETLKKSKNLTDKEKGELQARIEELGKSLLTKEELAAKERERLQGDHKKVVETLSSERDNWRTMFTNSTIQRSILDEAIKAEAYNPSQIVSLLSVSARLTEVLDGDGNPIPGQYVTKVTLQDVDKEGKPTPLDLTVAEALKRMKDRTEEFGNLFKSGVAGGLNSNTNRSGKSIDPAKMTAAQYREHRKTRGW